MAAGRSSQTVCQRPFVLATCACCVALVADHAVADEARDAPSASYDCGTLTLYVLLRLEGRGSDLRDIESCLPPPSPRGFSMKELRDAARPLGLSLAGVRLPGRRRLDRPALVFARRGPHGHYCVVRPVGHTGRLVQVIDALRDPEVLDMSDLAKSPEWTGLALIPSRPNWPARVSWCLVVAGIAGFGIWVIRRRCGALGSKPCLAQQVDGQ